LIDVICLIEGFLAALEMWFWIYCCCCCLLFYAEDPCCRT